MKLDKILVKLCKQKGLTLAALAKESGVKQPTLHGWSTGRAVHNLDDLKKVCSVLGVSLHYILYGEEDPISHNPEYKSK
jgi:transcriptional regulator with XRE-family HTH domain